MAWQTLTLIAVTAAVSGGLTALFFHWRTIRRIRQISFLLKRLAMGDLEQSLQNFNLGDGDELGQLRHAVNQLAAELRAIIQRISAERNTMATLLQKMTDGIISTDAEGLVTGINDAARQILALPPDFQPEGRTFMQVVRDYEMNTLLHKTFETGQEQVQLLEIGLHRPQLQVKITLIEEDWGRGGESKERLQGRSVLVVLQDLTELSRLERVRRDFVANISHELRTPLASIKLMTETLYAVLEDDPQAARDFLNRIDTEIDSLTQLVRELLELSRIESGQIKLNLRATDLRQVVEQSAERLRAQAQRHGLQLLTETGGEDSFPLALADPERVSQVLINLIHNAIKFTPYGGRITLIVEKFRLPPSPLHENPNLARTEGDKLLLRVCDTGVGIPPEDLNRVFERFYKVDKARTGAEAGTGLGLAIAKHIIHAHGGEIWAESEFGHGSTFSFTIPIFAIP